MAKTSHLRADGGSNIPSPRGSDDDLSATPIFDGPARAFFQIECEIGLHRANGVGHVLAHAARFLAAPDTLSALQITKAASAIRKDPQQPKKCVRPDRGAVRTLTGRSPSGGRCNSHIVSYMVICEF
jgi:hypothetical protein